MGATAGGPDGAGTHHGDGQGAQLMESAALADLHAALRRAGYLVVGPTVRDGAIVLAELESAADLPYGWGVTLEPGGYRLRQRSDSAAFGHAAGPQSWKPFLHPPRSRLWSARRGGGGFEVEPADEDVPRYAFLGVRPCDLRAIFIQDRVLGTGSHTGSPYATRRSAAFIIAVSCTEPGETCFCSSMGTGPQAGPGYDLALTELTGPAGSGGHRFLVDVGSAAGAAIMAEVPHRPAADATVADARTAVTAAADRMGRTMPAEGLHELMAASQGAARWDDVASRCLTCGNCTMVCPTCFCTTVEDSSDLTGEHAERWQRWDSCFDLDFSYLHGGSVRVSGKSRYRQWLTHKLGTWHDQFGSSGCVGCGRCIVWCPVGIDITAEVAALRDEATGTQPGSGGGGGTDVRDAQEDGAEHTGPEGT
ncbi:MAG TPA: 4Fe-4S dicluster domain-containing protein [Streptosporangiaceae bacterium]|nr:4Fe-4S dicluster domain-containing protein [Streptosporangiaceae bacterium]